MKNFQIRLISSIFYSFIFILSTLNYYTFIALIVTISIIACYELKSIFELNELDYSYPLTIFVGLSLFFLIITDYISFSYTFLLFIISTILSLWKTNAQLSFYTGILFSLSYIFIPLSSIILLGFVFNSTFENNTIIHILILIWCIDSFSYLTGKLFGKNKIFKKISPNKTLEGYIGGLILTLITAYIISKKKRINLDISWYALSILIFFSSNLGDLFMSKIKRIFGVKNSGKLIPGHGGILDRIDSMLISFPLIYIYIKFLSL